jgi:hypothetical protein
MMSCPIDIARCPYDGNAEIFIKDWNSPPIIKTESWRSREIRNKVYCKFHIKSDKVVKDRWQYNNMNIKIESLEEV